MSALVLCRVCVSEVSEFVYLLDLYYGDVAASLFIEDILKIDISNNHQGNHSPLIICETCNNTLKHFQLFYQTVKQAQCKYQQIKNFKREGDESDSESLDAFRDDEIKVEALDHLDANNSDIEKKPSITSKGINNLNLEQNIPFVKKFKFENRIEHCVDLNNAIEKTNLESQCNYLSTEEEAEIPRSENATKKMFAKFKKDEIFHNGEWLLSEDQKDEMLSLYFDLKCFKCNSLDFSKYKDLYEHSMKEHGEVPKLRCCRFFTLEREMLEAHILYKHILKQKYPVKYKLIECHICKKSIKHPKFKEHLSTHLPHDKREFQCDQCHAGFGTRGKLTHHLKINHSATKLPCDECGKLCRNKYMLTFHKKKVHCSSDGLHLCPECGKKFKDYTNFVNHVNEHKGIVEKVKCQLCDVVLKKICLSRHMRAHDPKNHKQCPHCPFKAFIIREHIKRVHDKVKPFACSVCPMTFSNESGLKDHVASRHTGIPLHTCEYCERTFMSKGNYYSHCKRMHPVQHAEKKLRRTEKNNTDVIVSPVKKNKRIHIIQGPEADSVMEVLQNRRRKKIKINGPII